MVGDYTGAIRTREAHPAQSVDDVLRSHSQNLRWDRELKNNLRRERTVQYSVDNIWVTQYRPFVRQHCYVEYVLVNNKYQQDSIFPTSSAPNRAICIPGIGANKPFSVLVADRMPDLHFLEFGQCFPRWIYPNSREHLDGAGLFEIKVERVDNITDTALRAFQKHYGEHAITKDAIFDYVYGVLHAPAYRQRFANDLSKALARIPFAPDFNTFADAGRDLGALHLGYETCAEHPLDIVAAQPGNVTSHHFQLGKRAMRFVKDDTSVLILNEHVRLAGIPTEAHAYVVNGRTPLEWFIDRYHVTQDRESGIINDPNGWFSKPEDLVNAIQRIVHVSVQTTRIVAGLPEPFAD